MSHNHERRRRDDDASAPSIEEIHEALESIEQHNLPGTAPISALKVLQESVGGGKHGIAINHRELLGFEIAEGKPMHGEMRSDDHLSYYEISAPIAEFRRDTPEYDCPECGCDFAVYKYNAYHHISGSESITCAACDEVFHTETWG